MMTILLLMQAAVPETMPATSQSAVTHDTRGACPAESGEGDIVVCGSTDQEQFRLRPLPPRYAKKGPGTEIDLGNGARANAYATTAQNPDGKPDKRIMVTLTLPF